MISLATPQNKPSNSGESYYLLKWTPSNCTVLNAEFLRNWLSWQLSQRVSDDSIPTAPGVFSGGWHASWPAPSLEENGIVLLRGWWGLKLRLEQKNTIWIMLETTFTWWQWHPDDGFPARKGFSRHPGWKPHIQSDGRGSSRLRLRIFPVDSSGN